MDRTTKIVVSVASLIFVAGLVALAGMPLGWYHHAAQPPVLVAVTDDGPDPFGAGYASAGVIPTATLTSLQAVGSGDRSGEVAGNEPGLYGGSGDLATCDVAGIADFLQHDDAKRSAFAEVAGIDERDVGTYLFELTPVVLLHDTWVTNHGFVDGHANPIQSVLQAGTAVLVDGDGIPRVRCACGNPLSEPDSGDTDPAAATGGWDGYSGDDVVSVATGGTVSSLQVVDVHTGQLVDQSVGVPWVATDHSYGPILIGMTEDQVRAAVPSISFTMAHYYSCSVLGSGRDWRSLTIWIRDDTGLVTGINTPAGTLTDHGVGDGSTQREIEAAYSQGFTVERNNSGGQGSPAVQVWADGAPDKRFVNFGFGYDDNVSGPPAIGRGRASEGC